MIVDGKIYDGIRNLAKSYGQMISQKELLDRLDEAKREFPKERQYWTGFNWQTIYVDKQEYINWFKKWFGDFE